MSRRFHVAMSVLVVATILLSALGMWLSGIRVPFAQIWPKLALYAVVLAGALFYRWRREPRLTAAFLLILWMGLFSDLHIFPMHLAGRLEATFQDELLAQMDRTLGLEVPQVLAWLEQHPIARDFLDRVYYTLVYLMAAALLISALSLRLRAAQEYILSCVLAVLICFPFFALFQARGPWVVYGYEPSPAQQSFMNVFETLKTAEVFEIDLGYVNGLLCFPSFHTILALLAAAALRSVPYVRWLAAAWAALIVISTVTTGWHYIIDVIAGVGVAAVCVALARAATWLEDRQVAVPTSPVEPALATT